jgi:replicative DNA helicase
MKLSAPLYQLKINAKKLKRSKGISMSDALNEIAKTEGYSSWSLLHSKHKDIYPKTREDILNYLNPGDLMLIGSRPGLGKTTFTLQILLQAMHEKRQCYFFSLEYTLKDVAGRLAKLDESIGMQNPYLTFDFSNDISSAYIRNQLVDKQLEGSIIAIDYLQLLDQKRSHPELQVQVEELKKFAKEKKCILIFISQLDRSFEGSNKERPSLEDVRLPNPMDLTLFNKTMFLHNGKKIFTAPETFELD